MYKIHWNNSANELQLFDLPPGMQLVMYYLGDNNTQLDKVEDRQDQCHYNTSWQYKENTQPFDRTEKKTPENSVLQGYKMLKVAGFLRILSLVVQEM